MRTSLAAIVIAVTALTAPVGGAQAGFFTEVVKANVKNAARHAKQSAKDAADLGRLVGGCVARRAIGGQC